MRVRLLQHASPPGTVRVWVGVVDGDVTTVRLMHQGQPLAAAQLALELPPGRAGSVQTALYEFATATPIWIEAQVQGKTVASLQARPLPRLTPGQRFNMLLGSCYYYDKANHGAIDKALGEVRKLCGGGAPDLCALMGDQVYLDLPWHKNFQDDLDWLRDRFLDDYIRNWFDQPGFGAVLASAPLLLIADDHELWNNAPERQFHMNNTHSAAGRQRWRQAALEAFHAFQRPRVAAAPGMPEFIDIEAGALRLLGLDLRWLRRAKSDFPANPLLARLDGGSDMYLRLQTALTAAHAAGAVPVILSGQGLFRGATGSMTDFEQADFPDFRQFCQAVAGHPQKLIYLTGDVHWGRVMYAKHTGGAANDGVYEAFVSPMALLDWQPRYRPWRDWPRHSDPDFDDLGPFRKHAGGSHLQPAHLTAVRRSNGASLERAGQTGDQLALLSIEHQGARMAAHIHYLSLNNTPSAGMTVRLF
ncbi:MAG: alkaline phosphatase D family protein [Lysobacterales bacterium]